MEKFIEVFFYMTNIVFMGTPDFAVPSLEALHSAFGVKAVVTNPDKPQGRGLKLTPSPVKKAALALDIPILQPQSLKNEEFQNELAALHPDIICVIAFKILPKSVYSLGKIGTFNVHGSLLPRYRGAAPIQWTIINGDKETGVTTFLLNDTVDTGNILLQKKYRIKENMTFGELYHELMPLAAEIAVETTSLLLTGQYSASPQDNSLATPAPKIFRDQCMIDWNLPAQTVINFIHGVSPIPAAWTYLPYGAVKIFACRLSEKQIPQGKFCIEDNRLFIGCASNSCEITELQIEGKPRMQVQQFLNGYRGEKTGIMAKK